MTKKLPAVQSLNLPMRQKLDDSESGYGRMRTQSHRGSGGRRNASLKVWRAAGVLAGGRGRGKNCLKYVDDRPYFDHRTAKRQFKKSIRLTCGHLIRLPRTACFHAGLPVSDGFGANLREKLLVRNF